MNGTELANVARQRLDGCTWPSRRCEQFVEALNLVTIRCLQRWRQCRAILSHEHRVTSAAVPDERLIHFEQEAEAAGLVLKTLSTEVEGGRRISVLELELRED